MPKIYSGNAKWGGKCSECGRKIEKGDTIFVLDEGPFFKARIRSICPECKQKLYPNVEAKSMWRRLLGVR